MVLYLRLWIVSLVVFGCAVEPAAVDGDPPETPKVFFKAGLLQGSFETIEKPNVFMWPTEVDGIVLSRQDHIIKRAAIIRKAEILTLTKKELVPKIGKLIAQASQLTKDFVGEECGLLAEDDGIFGPDAESTEVDEWKTAESPEEADAIEKCQANQQERLEISEQGIDPLNQKLGKVSLDLLTEIGDANFFGQIQALRIDMTNQGAVDIELPGFLGKNYSTKSEDPSLQVTNVTLDRAKGTVVFKVIGEDAKIYDFNLEISDSSPLMTIAGELSLRKDEFSERTTGRATFVGTVKE